MNLLIHCLILSSFFVGVLLCSPKVPAKYSEGAATVFIAVSIIGSVLGIFWELFGG